MLKKTLLLTALAIVGLNFNNVEFQENSFVPHFNLTNQVSAETPYQQGYKHGRIDAQWGTDYGDNILFQMASDEWQRGYSDGYQSVR